MTDENGSEEKTGLSGLSRQNILVLIGLSVSYLMFGIVYALAAPFLPGEALHKGVDSRGVGAILAAYELGQLILIPVAGKVIPYIGIKFSISCGCLLVGISTTMFGASVFLPDGSVFLIVSILLRLVSAAGASFLTCAGFIVILSEGFSCCSTIAFVRFPSLPQRSTLINSYLHLDSVTAGDGHHGRNGDWATCGRSSV